MLNKKSGLVVAVSILFVVSLYLYFNEVVCIRSYCVTSSSVGLEGLKAGKIIIHRDSLVALKHQQSTDDYNDEDSETDGSDTDEMNEEVTEIDVDLVEEYERKHPFDVLKKQKIGAQKKVYFIMGIRRGGQEILLESDKFKDAKTLCDVGNPNLWYTYDVSEYQRLRALAVNQLKSLQDGEVGVVNIWKQCKSNHTMSYPPSERNLHSFLSPNAQQLALMCEEAGVDLEIIVLLHNPEKMMRNWLTRMGGSGKEKKDLQVLKIMESQLAAMYSQLSQISPMFYRGFDMETMKFLDSGESLDGVNASTFKAQFEGDQSELGETQKSYQDEVEVAYGLVRGLMEPSNKPKKVLKNANGEAPAKLVFFAGLEGTGHHLWSQIVQVLIKRKLMEPACNVEGGLYKQFRRSSMWYNNKYTSGYSKSRARLVDELRKLKAGKVYSANLMDIGSKVCNVWAGMLSYPNFGGGAKNLQRPQMYTLAKACEEAGVDLEIILLMRNGDDVIASTVDHRDFGKGRTQGYEMKILTSNANAMITQFSAMDKSFFAGCVDYEDSEMRSLAKISEKLFNDPELLLNIAKTKVRPSSYAARHKGALERKNEQREQYIHTFSNTVDKIRHETCF